MAPRFRSLVAAMLIAILALGAGCSNSAGPDEDEDAGYVVRSSPKRAVRKLVETYEAMDEVEYADCFGADFEFWLNPATLATRTTRSRRTGDSPKSWPSPRTCSATAPMYRASS